MCMSEKKMLLEVKGFMDLGFDLANPEQMSPRVMNLIPGLKFFSVDRPVLPVAAEEKEKEKEKNKSGNGEEKEEEMKRYLRQWARSVAFKAVSAAT